MTDPKQAFLRAIEQDFDDDVPRLVYADWLDEHGDHDRAEFIRLQCELGRTPSGWGPESNAEVHRIQRERLTVRTAALLARHRREWSAGLPRWAGAPRFSRGFPHFARVHGQRLVCDGEQLRAVTPVGGRLQINQAVWNDAAVIGCEHLAAVTDLVLVDPVHPSVVRALTVSPHLWRLRGLDFGRALTIHGSQRQGVSDGDMWVLSAVECLPALADLRLGISDLLTVDGVQAVLESSHRAGLTSLSAESGPGGPVFADAFRSPRVRVTGLRSLTISGRRLGDAGAAVLAECSSLAGLTELSLPNNDLSDAGVAVLLASPHLRGVRRLDLEPVMHLSADRAVV